MLLKTSEIKIALLGNVSAGKTTVLNALFKDKYGEVNMKRTTAGVNYFRICAPANSKIKSKEDKGEQPSGNQREGTETKTETVETDKGPKEDNNLKAAQSESNEDKENEQTEEQKSHSKAEPGQGKLDDKEPNGKELVASKEDMANPEEAKERSWFPHTGEPRSAKSTLEEITEDNRRLRDSIMEVQEKWFDIELVEPLVEMRKGTQLVVVDIPGINEAGACNKYKDYVIAKWDTFDCTHKPILFSSFDCRTTKCPLHRRVPTFSVSVWDSF